MLLEQTGGVALETIDRYILTVLIAETQGPPSPYAKFPHL